jgi:hypothetical protein
MNSIVISQSMYFPWVGLFEQINLADIFVHYDDVQYSRGFYNRVQVKTINGIKWLTIPLKNNRRGQLINETIIDETYNWRKNHFNTIKQAYSKAPFKNEMLEIVERVFSLRTDKLSDITKESIIAIAEYFELTNKIKFMDSENVFSQGLSSERLLQICIHLGAKEYITGHGAKNYLDYEIFEEKNIKVSFMNYLAVPYNQLHGEYTPFVTALDLIANRGKKGKDNICSKSLYYKNFLMK